MAIITLPSWAKVREMRLRIYVPPIDGRRATNRKRMIGPTFSERWQLQAALAPLTRARTEELRALLASVDGRVNQLSVALTAWSHSASAASLASALVPGQDTITLSAGQTITPGTLMTIGTAGSTFQLVEIVASSSSTVHYVAPRIRYDFTSGATLALGTVSGLFEMADDDLSKSMISRPAYGDVTLDLVESV